MKSMKVIYSLAFLLLTLLPSLQTKEYRFLLLNDAHLLLKNDFKCHLGDCEDMGYYGTDSPLKLI
jgi:hypothetical protein